MKLAQTRWLSAIMHRQLSDELGYTHILAYDHVLGANPDRPEGFKGPYTYQSSFHEPFVLYSYIAAITQKIELVTGVSAC